MKKRIRPIVIILFLTLFFGCVSGKEFKSQVEEDIISILAVQSSFDGVIEERWGVVVTLVGDVAVFTTYRDGEVVLSGGDSMLRDDLLRLLRETEFEKADFVRIEKEKKETEDADAVTELPPFDGIEVEISINFEEQNLNVRVWNPRYYFNHPERYPNARGLARIVDQVSLSIGYIAQGI